MRSAHYLVIVLFRLMSDFGRMTLHESVPVKQIQFIEKVNGRRVDVVFIYLPCIAGPLADCCKSDIARPWFDKCESTGINRSSTKSEVLLSLNVA